MTSTRSASPEGNVTTPLNVDLSPRPHGDDGLGSSGVDMEDMTRMGKIQEFKVNIQKVIPYESDADLIKSR